MSCACLRTRHPPPHSNYLCRAPETAAVATIIQVFSYEVVSGLDSILSKIYFTSWLYFIPGNYQIKLFLLSSIIYLITKIFELFPYIFESNNSQIISCKFVKHKHVPRGGIVIFKRSFSTVRVGSYVIL